MRLFPRRRRKKDGPKPQKYPGGHDLIGKMKKEDERAEKKKKKGK